MWEAPRAENRHVERAEIRLEQANPFVGLGFRRFEGVEGAEICLWQADPDPSPWRPGIQGAVVCLEQADPYPTCRRMSDFPPQPFLHQIPRASARGAIHLRAPSLPPQKTLAPWMVRRIGWGPGWLSVLSPTLQNRGRPARGMHRTVTRMKIDLPDM